MAGKKERELQENIKALEKNIELVDDENVKSTILERKISEKADTADMELV
jgi:hypothetical protein